MITEKRFEHKRVDASESTLEQVEELGAQGYEIVAAVGCVLWMKRAYLVDRNTGRRVDEY